MNSINPNVQKLVKKFEDDLAELLNDIEFSNDDNDLEVKSQHLRDNLAIFSENLYNSIHELIIGLSKDSKESESEININKILFVCRLVHAMAYTCPNLRSCFVSFSDKRNVGLIKSKVNKIAITDIKVYFLSLTFYLNYFRRHVFYRNIRIFILVRILRLKL